MSELHKISSCCDDPNRKADVVFIHGLGGDAFSTWRHGKDNSTSWPHWLAEDFPDVGVWSLGYAASPVDWKGEGHSMALPYRAEQVLNLMLADKLAERPLFLICHSLGGLLAKQVLRKSDDARNNGDQRRGMVATNTRAVLFLATPHAGADLASLLAPFRAVFGGTISIEELRAHDAHLDDLFFWYEERSLPLGIFTTAYYETIPTKVGLIVTPTSARPGVGRPVPLEENHSSIAKPKNNDVQLCKATRNLLREYVLTPRRAHGEKARRLPFELPPAAGKFFGREDQLRQLTERLRAGKSCAVVGPAGMGKTALAAQALRDVLGENRSRLATSHFLDGVMYLDLYRHHGEAEPVWNEMANTLAGPAFLENKPAKERATEACRGCSVLVVFEGGEEADGQDNRASIKELKSVLSQENRWVLLTRTSSQTTPAESLELKEALAPLDAAALFDSLTQARVSGELRDQVLELLDGHPLAVTWAAGLLARQDDGPKLLVKDWQASGLPPLSDPEEAKHTLEWLFNRSVRGLEDNERLLLEAAGLLARAPFPLEAMAAALGSAPGDTLLARQGLRTLVQRGFLAMAKEEGYWQFTHVLGYQFARKETGSDPALRERQGNWLLAEIQGTLKNSGPGGTPTLAGLLGHGAALLRVDEDQRLWSALAYHFLHEMNDSLEVLGRLDLRKLVLGAVEAWLARILDSEARQPKWQHERSMLLNCQGVVLRGQGDMADALKAFRDSMAIRERLALADPSNAGRQQDLSESCNNIGDVLRAQGDLAAALKAYQDSLSMAERLALADPSNPVWQRNLSVSNIKIGVILRAQGDLVGALKAFQNSLAIRERLAQTDPTNAGRQWDLAVCFSYKGGVLRAQGDLVGALKAFQDSLVIRERLVKTNFSNAIWQRGLSVSYDNIGYVLRAQGDLASALKAFQDSLAIAERLIQADPSNTRWQVDLSASYDNIGDVLRAQGDLPGALKAYQDSLAIAESLARYDLSNALWQRNLAVSYTNMGYVLRAQGDLPGALKAHQDSLAIKERLVFADPSNAGWQRSLSVSFNNIGDVLRAQGDLAEALKAHQNSLAIKERLALSDPSNASWQRSLSVSINNLGDVLRAQGDLAGALKAFRDSLAIRELLTQLDPTNASWQWDLSVNYENIGRVLRRQGDLAGALKTFKDALAIRGRLAKVDPSNAVWQEGLAYNIRRMALVHEKLGERAAALKSAERSLAIGERLLTLDGSNKAWQQGVVFTRAMVARLRGRAGK